MILSALLMAGAARCASPEACPSDSELKLAYLLHADEELWAAMQAASAATGDIVLMTQRRVKRVSDVYCGELDSDSERIICRFSLVYSNGAQHNMASLSRGEEGWVIHARMSVWSDRKGRR
ncbi:MAG TPA: hypothetical protein VEA60_12995 [Allosphingosinicella sp.]|nr:hypothetical protein [Allosphingosinicella sp.]